MTPEQERRACAWLLFEHWIAWAWETVKVIGTALFLAWLCYRVVFWWGWWKP